MKKNLIVLFVIAATGLTGVGLGLWFGKQDLGDTTAPIFQSSPRYPDLNQYSIEKLSENSYKEGVFESIESSNDENIISKIFSFEFNPDPGSRSTKKTTGLVNIPVKEGVYPMILMLRGYVDQETYQTGMGTRNAAEAFSKVGFITMAPDFLGYAESDSESGNIFESRFQTYTTTLSLIESLNSHNSSLGSIVDDKWDGKNIFIWAHSNGGQIALNVLSITRKDIATVLWAPVSKPFPYSILYFTDESDDGGKLIRGELSSFEKENNVDHFSFTNYLDKISTIFEVHQGTIDDAVPKEWSDELVGILKKKGLEVGYFVYPGADHNLKPGWDLAIERNIDFFRKNIK